MELSGTQWTELYNNINTSKKKRKQKAIWLKEIINDQKGNSQIASHLQGSACDTNQSEQGSLLLYHWYWQYAMLLFFFIYTVLGIK